MVITVRNQIKCSAFPFLLIGAVSSCGGLPRALRAWLPAWRFRQWAHMLGYGGHFLTKSRRYSVTFGALRAARTAHRRAQRHPDGERDPWGRPLDEAVVLVLSTWTYAGTGYTTTPGAELAAASAARARERRSVA